MYMYSIHVPVSVLPFQYRGSQVLLLAVISIIISLIRFRKQREYTMFGRTCNLCACACDLCAYACDLHVCTCESRDLCTHSVTFEMCDSYLTDSIINYMYMYILLVTCTCMITCIHVTMYCRLISVLPSTSEPDVKHGLSVGHQNMLHLK